MNLPLDTANACLEMFDGEVRSLKSLLEYKIITRGYAAKDFADNPKKVLQSIFDFGIPADDIKDVVRRIEMAENHVAVLEKVINGS